MDRVCILLVEDDADNLELVRILLDRAGFEVLSAMDGQRGLDLAHEKLPALVLLDLTIPERRYQCCHCTCKHFFLLLRYDDSVFNAGV